MRSVVYCPAIPSSATAAPGADPITAQWPSWPFLTSCGEVRFSPAPGVTRFSPVAVFSQPAEAENGSLPSHVALREALANPEPGSLEFNRSGWRLASEKGGFAFFIGGSLGGLLQVLNLQDVGGRWRVAGSGYCYLTSTPQGRAAISWRLAQDQPHLNRRTRQVRIVLTGGGCRGGMSLTPFIRPPIFRHLGRRLLLSIVTDPLPSFEPTCEGVYEPPITIKLPSRLGNRKLFDGATYPPTPAAAIRPGR